MHGAQRYLVLAYMAVGFLLGVTLTKALAALALATGLPDPAILGQRFTLATILGFAAAAGVGFWTWKNPRAHTFSHDVFEELNKVTWPSRKETQTATVVVLVATIICSAILGVFDTLWSFLTGLIYS